MFQSHNAYEKCRSFFDELVKLLPNYNAVASCNKDLSAYLVPKGTEDQITYAGKPVYSFRVSDHWNWKTSLNKNPDEQYVQCYTKDLPWCKRRTAPRKASPAILACAVCFYDSDNLYHVIYGEKFDRKTKTWSWIETNPNDLVKNEWFQLACGVKEGDS